MDKIKECPVLYPTLKEFQNFQNYVESLDQSYKNDYGMVKIVPPKGWKPRSKPFSIKSDNLIVNGPIQQNISGKGGIYECLHIQKKSMTLKEYLSKTQVFDKLTDNLSSEEVEKMFWRNIVFSPPLYGADLLNTLMDKTAGEWNLGELKSLLSNSLNTKVKGVNTPYCYIGSWKCLFCWHKEDLDLSAINYLHQGKSKFWYSIPASQGHFLERQAKIHFPEQFSKCNEYLRHKTTIINPYMLKEKIPQLKIHKVEHKEGEFICVFGGAYHTGFNFGFNIAEAVNYGTMDWLSQLLNAKSCTCSKNSVRASYIEVYKNLEKNSQIKKTKYFTDFKIKLYRLLDKEKQQEEELEEERGIKSLYSKKIRKQNPKKISKLCYKGEVFTVDNWAQCDKCKIWRKTNFCLNESSTFKCSAVNKRCNLKERIERDYISLDRID